MLNSKTTFKIDLKARILICSNLKSTFKLLYLKFGSYSIELITRISRVILNIQDEL